MHNQVRGTMTMGVLTIFGYQKNLHLVVKTCLVYCKGCIVLELVIALSKFFSVSEYIFHGCFPDSAIVVRENFLRWVKNFWWTGHIPRLAPNLFCHL